VLFIQFFQPFGIEKVDFDNSVLVISGFGLIILVTLMVTRIAFHTYLVKTEREPGENDIYLSLFYITLLVISSLGFIFYLRYVGQSPITFNTVTRVVIICLSLPVTLNLKGKIIYYKEQVKKLARELDLATGKLENFSENYTNRYVELISENDTDNFRIQVSEIVYARSADNYVEVGYHDNDAVKKKMIRNTLRDIEKQLLEFNSFVRTHRTSLVNIQYINKLNKNFNTYWLSLDKTKETIPVSRQYLVAVKDLV
jgi:DNA-binding LytR/AlgR family response regulator